MSKDLVVGIDLGTTNTCVACFTKNELKIIENKEGKYTTPSYVFFAEKDKLIVGQNAERMAANKPEHGIYEMKRFIGRQFHEVHFQQNLEELPFIVRNLGGNPLVYLETFNYYQSPEQISTHILRKIKEDVSERLGTKITKAVITVPAHFNVSQRKATLQAAKDAEFTVLKLLSEPTAAALTYFYETKNEVAEKKYCLVFDLGGGTFDVAIVERKDENINIIGVDGDSHLGGHDFDNLIFNYLCRKLRTTYNLDPRSDKRIMRRLKNASTSAKELLSTAKETPVILEGVFKTDVVDILLSRKEFEEIAEHLFKKTIDIVDRCLKNCKLAKNDIGKIILAGGSTHIPRIQELLRDYFGGKALSHELHPEECVAKGAALQAAILSKNTKQKIKYYKIREVISSSLGIKGTFHKMEVIIEKNKPIPICKTVTYATMTDQQDVMYFKIYEGERADTRNNIFLGSLKITNLTPGPPQKCKVTLRMNIDENGVLTVTAKEKGQNNITTFETALVEENRCRIIPDDTDLFEDSRFLEFADIKEYLLTYCHNVQYNFENCRKNTDSHKHVYLSCQAVQKEITSLEVQDEKKLMQLGAALIKMCAPTVKKFNFKNMPSSSAIERKLKKSASYTK